MQEQHHVLRAGPGIGFTIPPGNNTGNAKLNTSEDNCQSNAMAQSTPTGSVYGVSWIQPDSILGQLVVELFCHVTIATLSTLCHLLCPVMAGMDY
jgi:hypothetical protein